MKIVLKSTKDNIQPDWGWTLYFITMFCFYQHTYIQLAAQLFIIGYVFIKKLYQNVFQNVVKLKFSRTMLADLFFYLTWMGLLVLALYISGKTYAIYHFFDSNTVLTVFRVFAIGFAMFYYCDTKEIALSIIEAMVLGVFTMCVLILFITPPSSYFDATIETGFGSKLSYHRNQVGASTASMFITSYYLQKYAKFKGGYAFAIFFVFITVLTGSRGSMLQLAIEVAFILLINGNFVVFFFFVIALGLGLLLVLKVPILYDNIWVRFMNAAETLSGDNISDGSTMGREYYKEIAWKMFLRHPWRGYGVDGFKGYLYFHPIYKGQYLPAVYSHCNFSELMSSLGVIGLLIWYIPTFSTLIKSLTKIRYSKLMEMSFILLFALIVLDYARIPWTAHITSYPYIVLYALIRLLNREIKQNNKKVKKQNKITNNKEMEKSQNEPEAKDKPAFSIALKEETVE